MILWRTKVKHWYFVKTKYEYGDVHVMCYFGCFPFPDADNVGETGVSWSAGQVGKSWLISQN